MNCSAASSRNRSISRLCFLGLLFALAGGCATTATTTNPIGTWQRRIAEYVRHVGHGDPSVLRNLAETQSRDAGQPALVTFSTMEGAAGTPQSSGSNVQSVLVGIERLGGHTWFVFIAAVIRDNAREPSSVEDLRLVAMTQQGDRFVWQLDEPDPQRLAGYEKGLSSVWSAPFPARGDTFVMKLVDDTIQVIETRSGVEFELALTEPL